MSAAVKFGREYRRGWSLCQRVMRVGRYWSGGINVAEGWSAQWRTARAVQIETRTKGGRRQGQHLANSNLRIPNPHTYPTHFGTESTF